MSSEDFGVHFSEDDSDDNNHTYQPIELRGTLCKWTNYIHGWQNRYFTLRDSKLSYYKSENETSFGCRGSICVERATVQPHDIDECRFDVCLNDSVWYLRAASEEEKKQWVEAIEQTKDMTDLCRHGSSLSLTPSTASTSSHKRLKGSIHHLDTDLCDKLSEIDTYRDIVLKQMETLQAYFDLCGATAKGNACNGMTDGILSNELCELSPPPSPNVASHQYLTPNHLPLDVLEKHAQQGHSFRGEALTFKATTGAIITSLHKCVDVMNAREDRLKKCMEKEFEKRRRLEDKIRALSQNVAKEHAGGTKYVVLGGPDYEEGPHSMIGEDEFYDAVESALDKMEEEDQFRERLRIKHRSAVHQPVKEHPLWPTIEQYSNHQLKYAKEPVDGGVWQLFCEDGEMKLYKRELEEDGLVVDPLKAVHQVKGVTAHEMAHHFWSPDVRFEWDTTIEQMTILDNISEDTIIFLQVHKRVWPTAQRDALFWSHIRKVDQDALGLEDGACDTWIVCNKSTEHPDALNDDQCVRVDLLVCLVCQTFVDGGINIEEGAQIPRKNITCKITYCSIVNPGGWAPSSVLRAVYKREYPRFLKRFTQYVIDKSADLPVAFSGLKILNHSKHWRG